MYKEKYLKLFKKVVNRETITYGIAGVLTTIINFVSFHVLCNILAIPDLTSNAIAWVVAVIFAYLVNNKIVFLSGKVSAKEEVAKVAKFFGARVLSFVIEELGMLLFVVLLGFQNLLVKAALAVIVIIMNYFFSKLYIFKK